MLNCNYFLWSKLYFQHHNSSLQCHMIFRNHNNIKKKFWLLSMLKTVIFDEYQIQKTVTFDQLNASLLNKKRCRNKYHLNCYFILFEWINCIFVFFTGYNWIYIYKLVLYWIITYVNEIHLSIGGIWNNDLLYCSLCMFEWVTNIVI